MAAPVYEPDDAITGINVIPLVDIVLVLLIIFMMTASFIVAPALKVQLPEVSKAEEPPPRSLHFLVDASGVIYLNQQTVVPEAITDLVRKEVTGNPELQVLVSADRGVPYGEVVRLLDLVRTGGVKRFAISVESAGE